ncbi:MAG: MAGE domain-containing protein [Thaumarchaeota archaeon]|nr:MAGE domain-containing protein [Candidatus Calditenuaceae archaeon]MDW8186551.1 hypothetical protein [Nitrososphaerota archaeon]
MTEEVPKEVEEHPELGKLERKVALAAAMILTSGHRQPGVRGWELRRRLGKNYEKVLEALDSRLRRVGLKIKSVQEEGSDDPDRTRYYVVISEPLALYDLGTMGYSMDEVAILAVTLAFLFTNNDRAPYKQVVELLESKYPKWRVESVLERLTRRGYLMRTEDDSLVVGWRSKVEVDRQELLRAITALSSPETSQRAQEEDASRE